jgi:hypothetical protein
LKKRAYYGIIWFMFLLCLPFFRNSRSLSHSLYPRRKNVLANRHKTYSNIAARLILLLLVVLYVYLVFKQDLMFTIIQQHRRSLSLISCSVLDEGFLCQRMKWSWSAAKALIVNLLSCEIFRLFYIANYHANCFSLHSFVYRFFARLDKMNWEVFLRSLCMSMSKVNKLTAQQ